jgi:hypothetical protein
MEKFVEVYVAPDITYAYLAKAQLENAGIPAQIANENLAGAYSIDGMAPRVLVPQSKVPEAREVIEEMTRSAAEDTEDFDEDNEEEADDAADEDTSWR